MKITIWGARGSLPSPSPENNYFGGNTSCVQVCQHDAFLILDAGSGIRRLGDAFPKSVSRVDILLTHLHLDHIMGLGFFAPLYNPKMEINIWGPTSTVDSLLTRLQRYLSPPLFPIRLRDLPCRLQIFEINHSAFHIGPFRIQSAYVCHPGPTLGFRIDNGRSVLTYLPDHEPVLGASHFPHEPAWTSGYELALGADLLLHDAQFTTEEYRPRVGWGHSSADDALTFADMTDVRRILYFHHDPSHSDDFLRGFLRDSVAGRTLAFEAGLAAEGDTLELPE